VHRRSLYPRAEWLLTNVQRRGEKLAQACERELLDEAALHALESICRSRSGCRCPLRADRDGEAATGCDLGARAASGSHDPAADSEPRRALRAGPTPSLLPPPLLHTRSTALLHRISELAAFSMCVLPLRAPCCRRQLARSPIDLALRPQDQHRPRPSHGLAQRG